MVNQTVVRVCALAVSLSLTAAGSAGAQVACGDVITDKRVMTADLNGCVGTALTIGSGGSLDMDGYAIDLAGAVGVLMNGDGGTLRNGAIRLCGGSGVVVTGVANKVENVVVRTCFNGFEISGERNKLERAVAVQNTNEGFLVLAGGAKTSIKQSYAYGNVKDGFQVDGEGSKLAGVVAHDNTEAGIRVGAAKVKVGDALALENGTDGIVVTGASAKLQRVVAIQNAQRDIGLDGTGAKLQQGTTVGTGALASLWITGSGNKIDRTTAAFGFNNLFVAGGQNKAQRMLSVGSPDAGIDLGVTASENALSKSFSVWSGTTGIRASGGSSLNTLMSNAASDSGDPFDLIDQNPGCGTNTWSKNGGVGNLPCID